ncbi:hypothetical protein [Campylobacter cuniculorum]|uniref:Thioredoxin reductase n=2 Tax=Campylobacter cuniculorum TaxID=374106 RepID=A0A1W6BUM1_9BACT|nr:hypothetical protein [Campylobacter cuniculorum]ARJ55785.1 hypothetical protein CCUN_0124 [Campylobacter cuniculorum DSM 23162 = LMG 24588]ARJ56687.1 hypothetical protein CCUN_1090 [Campylobacter cuniculorum DSM 23162 = LMG 24588]QOR04162.1 hypothetical protein A0071_08365 [Campylobacter cuniculorum]QOR05004.1 hypothetical protein A0071_03475 [Campylobacter cuniculorum]
MNKLFLATLLIFTLNACKGEDMNDKDIKMVHTPNGGGIKLNTKTNEFLFNQRKKPTGKYTQEYTKALLEAVHIVDNSPYKKSYEPKYLDPEFHTGQKSTLVEFKDWQKIYLKDPIKGAIAPWTKAEKAYFHSLDGEGRYNYLVKRSGLVCTPVDLKDSTLTRPKRPKEKRFINAYEQGMKDYKEAKRLDYKGYDLFQKAIKNLSYAYEEGKDYKAGLALAELGYSKDYFRAIIGKLDQDENNEALLDKLINEFLKANYRSIRIYEELIEKYDLGDAYWGLYVYSRKIEDTVFDDRFYFVQLEDSSEELYKNAFEHGAYGAFGAKANTIYSDLIAGEYQLCLGILGNKKAFYDAAIGLSDSGLKSRGFQALWLGVQLGDKKCLERLYHPLYGIHKNPLKQQLIKDFAKNPPYDKYGMLPFLDELISTEWIIDSNEYDFISDVDNGVMRTFLNEIDEGKIKDPRDVDSTPESRWEFDKYLTGNKTGFVRAYSYDIPNHWSEADVEIYLEELYLQAKLAALTPPQGYPNAPYYFTPERLEWIYKKGDLDAKLDPRIPAIYRANFPEELRAKIQAYAKEHNIKE